VYEQNHRFLRREGQVFRQNEIWRDKRLKFQGGQVVATELVARNFGRVMYEPVGVVVDEQA
jgi:vancomycin resistance protein VanW